PDHPPDSSARAEPREAALRSEGCQGNGVRHSRGWRPGKFAVGFENLPQLPFMEYDHLGLSLKVVALYVWFGSDQHRMKPRCGVLWMTVALMVAVGFLVFTCAAWHRPVQYALLGVVWGAGVGIAATLLYLRK